MIWLESDPSRIRAQLLVSENSLLSCPFCGSQDLNFKGQSIRCSQCKARGPTDFRKNFFVSIKDWNTRSKETIFISKKW